MKKNILIAVFLLSVTASFGQLLPGIGIGSLPNDTESVCAIPLYSGSFSTSGYQAGDTVPDFTLYKSNGDSVNLATELAGGVPVLLVTGNYTCPVFRGKISDINTMATVYGSMLKIFVVYVVEAHPIIDVSPYSGTVWVPSANYTDSVLFRQPATYGQRKEIIDSLLAHYTINVPILLDGPCNNWWLNYGPSPNNAYLIKPDGVVATKNAWFNRAPDNMYCSIDSLLAFNSGHCVVNGNNGTLSYTLNDDSVSVGVPTQTLSIHSTLTNLSTTDNCVIDIVKKVINIPAAWQSALCADICYASTVDSTRITLAPSEVQPFYFYFYTGSIPDSGFVRVLFRNVNNPNNKFGQGFYGYTSPTAIADNFIGDVSISVFPNPAFDQVTVSLSAAGNYLVEVRNIAGWKMHGVEVHGHEFGIDVKEFPAGVYFVSIMNEKKNRVIKKLVKF